MRHLPGLGALSLLVLAAASAVHADDYFVPSAWTLQDAIDDAADNAAAVNRILLDGSPVTGNFTILGDFDAGHTLSIRPDRDAGRVRATLLAAAMNQPVLSLSGPIGGDAGYITIEDLDILRRDSGSSSDLVSVSGMSHVTLDRCRVGLDMQAPTSAGHANLRILYPIEVVIRNCLFFSARPGGLDRGISVENMIDAACSVFLYNNLVADHALYGILVNDGPSNPGALVLLRNNVVVNSMAVSVEPFGYRSDVNDATVVTSHNVVFATPGREESVMAGGTSIGGGAAAFGISMGRPAAIPSFVTTTWSPAPPYDGNPAFYRLNPAGPLHDAPADTGQTVALGAPHARDYPVALDFDLQGRPGGVPAHTDRGPDQVEAAAATGVASIGSGAPEGPLTIAARPNPSSHVVLHFASSMPGDLSIEVFDVAGRRLASDERHLAAGERGSWSTRDRLSGVAFYRAKLRTPDGRSFAAGGKVALLK